MRTRTARALASGAPYLHVAALVFWVTAALLRFLGPSTVPEDSELVEVSGPLSSWTPYENRGGSSGGTASTALRAIAFEIEGRPESFRVSLPVVKAQPALFERGAAAMKGRVIRVFASRAALAETANPRHIVDTYGLAVDSQVYADLPANRDLVRRDNELEAAQIRRANWAGVVLTALGLASTAAARRR